MLLMSATKCDNTASKVRFSEGVSLVLGDIA